VSKRFTRGRLHIKPFAGQATVGRQFQKKCLNVIRARNVLKHFATFLATRSIT